MFLAFFRLLASFFMIFFLGLTSLYAQDTPVLDRKAVESIVREYLLSHPEVIRESIAELEKRQQEEEVQSIKKITGDTNGLLYQSTHHTIIGNPKGDVTLVEFFDYNCSYCKKSVGDLQKLLETDKNLRVILKEFPILAPESREASVVALALREQFEAEKLWKFHAKLLSIKGKVGREQALEAAKELGADMKKLEEGMKSPKIAQALEESRELGDKLRIEGTPTYIVAQELYIGARGYDKLKKSIDSWRKCGKSECE